MLPLLFSFFTSDHFIKSPFFECLLHNTMNMHFMSRVSRNLEQYHEIGCQGCCNKVLQTGWLKPQKLLYHYFFNLFALVLSIISCLAVLEARSLRSSVGCSKGCEAEISPWIVDGYSSLGVSTMPSLSVPVSKFPRLKRSPFTLDEAHPNALF